MPVTYQTESQSDVWLDVTARAYGGDDKFHGMIFPTTKVL
jgi:hypothetical protein